MEAIMGDEQKRLFRETQALMSLLEGFSDYVMDEVGRGLVEGVETISARFHERRQRRSGFERAVLRLTGMDLKLEQYAKGEHFVRAVAEARGRSALARIWDGPETLPTAEEIAEPSRSVRRGAGGGGRAGPDGGRPGGAAGGGGDRRAKPLDQPRARGRARMRTTA